MPNEKVIPQGLKWVVAILTMEAIQKQFYLFIFFFSRNIGLVENNGKFIEVEAQSLVTYATRPSCYNVVVVDDTTGGTHFYFGGPRDILHNV